MTAPAAVAARFAVIEARAAWLGAAADAGDGERWRLALIFAPAGGDPTLGLPHLTPANFQLIATDGGAPAVVIAAAPAAGPLPAMDLLVAKASEPAANSDGRWFRLAIVGAPGVAASGAVGLIALRQADPTTPTPSAPSADVARPPISYLARDYPAFVQTLQDTLRLLDPAWRDTSPGDVGVTLTEVLAYAADNLSYFQDAVATEAYLSTARRRLSVRRHARQLGYDLREGCNARAWTQVQVLHPFDIPRGTAFLAGADLPVAVERGGAPYLQALQQGAVVFEAMAPARLRPGLNTLRLHDWGQDVFKLSAGATACVFRDVWAAPAAPGKPRPRRLDVLEAGDVLMFEHTGGEGAPADPNLRWPVRLRRLERLVLPDPADPDGLPVVSAVWDEADALPFDLPVSARDPKGRGVEQAVASGNLVPTDQGRTVHAALARPAAEAPYRPRLPGDDLVYVDPLDLDAGPPASALMTTDADLTLPAVVLQERRTLALLQHEPSATASAASDGAPDGIVERHAWQVRRDLLSSGPFARDFVAEADNDGVRLRFGDGRFGRRPDPDSTFLAVFRTGDMSKGGVAREAICTVVAPDAAGAARLREGVVAVRNPLPAAGAAAPDPVNLARRLATVGVRPQALAALEDYERAALGFRDVDQAAAELGAGGSWPQIQLFVRRRYGRPIDAAFAADLADHLADRMIAGRRLVVRAARPVGLLIFVEALAEAGRFADTVTAALDAAFSPDGGYFCLDDWPLGSTVFASAIVARAMAVSGVVQARVRSLQRLDRPTAAVPPLAAFGPHEYPSVDNRAARRYGRIHFQVTVAR